MSPRKRLIEPHPLNLNRLHIEEIRLGNLNKLIAIFEKQTGSQAVLRRFAKEVGLSENLLSQIRTETRTIGDKTARALEHALHLGRGWMDHEHTDYTAESPEERRAFAWFAAIYRNLSPKNQRKWMRLMTKAANAMEKPEAAKKAQTKK